MSTKSFNPSQIKAIDHKNSDILISAGAGSGKTATLTERIIRKILAGSDIDKMLVVTFTKESANDLKNKIQKSIVERMKTANESEKEHLYSQIVKIGGADISTIHSFCLKVIRPNFVSLPIDNNFRIGEENEIDFKEEHSEQKFLLIEVKPFESESDCNLLHFIKAFSPIEVTLFGIVKEVNPVL